MKKPKTQAEIPSISLKKMPEIRFFVENLQKFAIQNFLPHSEIFGIVRSGIVRFDCISDFRFIKTHARNRNGNIRR